MADVNLRSDGSFVVDTSPYMVGDIVAMFAVPPVRESRLKRFLRRLFRRKRDTGQLITHLSVPGESSIVGVDANGNFVFKQHDEEHETDD